MDNQGDEFGDPRQRDQHPQGPDQSGPEQHSADYLLGRVADHVRSARPMPLSSSAMINREEVLGLLEAAISSMPEELRHARWLIKEREEYLARVRREGDDIIVRARERAATMVQKTEVARAAELRARQIIDEAEADARRLRMQVEDFCDQKLGSFEIVLERTMKSVHLGRQKLQGTEADAAQRDPLTQSQPRVEAQRGPESAGFYDQEQRARPEEPRR